MTLQTLPVLTAPLFDPGNGRRQMELPAGLNLAEIVAHAVPGYTGDPGLLRVVLVTERGTYAAPAEMWTQMRPKPGVRVVIRVVPGKDVVRSLLLVVIAVTATLYAPGLAGTLGIAGDIGTALVAAGLTVVGQLLVNALIPLEQSQLQSADDGQKFNIDGWRNQRRPGSPVPLVCGMHRMAPPFAATSYTEIIGDDQYVRALFCFGYGPVRLSDHRIGQTPITDFEDVQIEVREGREDDAPIAIYPNQVIEESAGIDLVRPLPVDTAGDPLTDQPTVETPITRFTATNAAEASVIVAFSSGLYRANDDGSVSGVTVDIRIRQRFEGLGDWADVTTLSVKGADGVRESVLRQHTWTLPSRGRWQIEVTRMTDDATDTRRQDKATLAAVQSIRPEYPINLDKPLALVALRLRATHQLNGPLESYNALVEKEGLVLSDSGWEEGYGRTPATAYLQALMGPSNPFPVAESGIDMDQIADWHDWCLEKGLKFDRVHEDAMGLGEMLRAICAAGRASPRQDGLLWGVVIDRPDTLVVDHISPRNSEQFEWSRPYFQPPDGFRVRFLDETNDYEEAEMLVPWPGNDEDVALTEALDLPGKVDPDEVYIEATRRMLELEYRPDTFSAMQSGAARLATRGDLVMGSFDVLDRTVAAARVVEVRDRLVLLDEEIEQEPGYGMRFKSYADADDLVGVSRVVALVDRDHTGTAVTLSSDAYHPNVGEVVHIGPVSTESMPLKVRGVEGAQDFSSRVIMLPAAPEIDTIIDALVPPAWSGVVGSVATYPEGSLPAPLFVSVTSAQTEVSGTDIYDLQISLRADPTSILISTGFEIDYREVGDTNWTTLSFSVASGGTIITGLARGTDIELVARAIAATISSPATATITITIGEDDPAVPAVLENEAISVLGSLGHAIIGVAIPHDSAAAAIRIYRVPAGATLVRETHSVGAQIAVTNGSTVSYVDGDATRTNILTGGGFGSADGWTEGDGWLIEAGAAGHAPGLAGDLSKPVPMAAGNNYRVAFDVIEYVAGSVTPKLIGGSAVSGQAVSQTGVTFDLLGSVSDNTDIAFAASADFDGKVDDVVVFIETAGCIDAGVWDYYIEPQNEQNIVGPASGPFQVTVY